MNTVIIVLLTLLLPWYISCVLCIDIWVSKVNYEVAFWPGVLIYTPVVNTVFLIFLVKKFLPRDFFDLHKLTDAFKKKNGDEE